MYASKSRCTSEYLKDIRSKLFPIRLIDMPLNDNIMSEKNYARILALCPKIPTCNEMIYLLKYKKFIDYHIDDSDQHTDRIYSMCDVKEVDQMQELLMNIIDQKVSGCIVETGSWRGGVLLYSKAILNDMEPDGINGILRSIYLFDTFKYFPKPRSFDDLSHADDSSLKDRSIHSIVEMLFENMQSVNQVRSNFERFNLFDDNVHLIEGLFEDTVPKTKIGDIAILRLDSDYYESTILVLEHYYFNIVHGGYLIIDDYNNHMLGCKDACQKFRNKYNITNPIIDDHGGSVYWQI